MKNKLYTETKGYAPFDWNEAIERGLRGEIERASIDFSELLEASNDWVTCACGNQCGILKRYCDGEPKDKLLSSLGYLFHENINDMNWGAAQTTLQLIEKRSAELIAEITKNKKNEN